MIIAIDGPSGSGKSSTAKAVAARLGITYLDTGAMYRVITLKCLREGIPSKDDTQLKELTDRTKITFQGVPPDMKVFMDGEDVSDAIRNDEVTKNVSDYCAPSVVRTALVAQQRTYAKGNSVILDGRDIGTVVFPDAQLKFYMVASVEERAKRRQLDFANLGIKKSIQEIAEDLELRDHKDSTRANSPLKKADGAEEIDTTKMTLEQQIEFIVEKAKSLSDSQKSI